MEGELNMETKQLESHFKRSLIAAAASLLLVGCGAEEGKESFSDRVAKRFGGGDAVDHVCTRKKSTLFRRQKRWMPDRPARWRCSPAPAHRPSGRGRWRLRSRRARCAESRGGCRG